MTSSLTRRHALAAGGAAAFAGHAQSQAKALYWPKAALWEALTPSEAGFDQAPLSAALEIAKARNSRSLLVLRAGRIAAEWYAPGSGPDEAQEVASVGKSLVSVLIGMAIDDGKVKNLDQPAADFIPAWRRDPRSAITLRHLVTMTSGLDDTGLVLRNVAGDQFALNSAAPLAVTPGSRWRYDTAAYHLMFHILARAVGEPFEVYAQRKLLGPLGMTQTTWLTNQGQGAAGPVTNYYTARCSARDLGRFGLFAQRGGQWNGRPLVSPAFLRQSIAPSQDLNPAYGYLWWNNRAPGVGANGKDPGLRFPGSPSDVFAAMGAGAQLVMVAPSRDLVVVRQGRAPGPGDMPAELLAGVIAALRA